MSKQETQWKEGDVADPNGANAIVLGDAELNRYNYLPIPIDQQKKDNLSSYYPLLIGGGVIILLIMLFKK